MRGSITSVGPDAARSRTVFDSIASGAVLKALAMVEEPTDELTAALEGSTTRPLGAFLEAASVRP